METEVIRKDHKWAFYYRLVDTVTKEGESPTTNSAIIGPIDRNDYFTGGKNPHWRANIRDGVNASTNMSGVKYRLLRNEGSASVTRWSPTDQKEITYSTTGDFIQIGNATLALSFLPTGSADTVALQTLYKHIKRTYQHVQTGVTIGEWKETWRMMRDAAKTVRKAVDKYVAKARREAKAMERAYRRQEAHRRGVNIEKGYATRKARDRARSAAQKAARDRYNSHKKAVNKRISDLWLEFSFGIRPTISDVKGHAEALARMSVESYRTRVSGFGEVADSPIQSDTSHTRNGYIMYRKLRRVMRLTQVRYIAGYEEKNYSSVTEELADKLGLTLEEFIPTVHELIPYSWLLDYFTNVGDVLAAAFTQTKHITWIVKTIRQGIVEEDFAKLDIEKIKSVLGPHYRDSSGSCGNEQQEVWQVSRVSVPVGALPLPTLTLEWVPIDSQKWLNIGALINNRRV